MTRFTIKKKYVWHAGIELALPRGCLEALGKLLKLENWDKKLEKL